MAFLSEKLISASGATEATDDDFNLVTQLYQFDGSNGAQNNTFLDSSSNGFTVTRAGNSTQGTFSPFSADEGKWSVSFDGTDDYLQIANSADFNLGSGDFTLEAYVFQTSDASTASNSHNIFNKWNNTSSAKSYAFRITSSSGQKLQFFWSTDGNNNNYITSNDSLTSNQWHHVAVVNNGGTITLYIDGTAQSSTGTAGTLYSASVNLNIGRTDADSGSQYFDGFISNARLVKGTAVYTSNFTPSTSPLTAVTNTKLLTCCSNRFRDKSTSAHTITPSSSPKIQPFSPFAPSAAYDAAVNGGSGYFDGSGDYLTVPTSDDFAFGTGDYTIEAWVFLNSTGSGQHIYDARDNSATSARLLFYVTSAGKLRLLQNNTTKGTSSDDVPLNSWVHIAVCRSSATGYLFMNGAQVATWSSDTLSILKPSSNLYIGANYSGSGNYTSGFISNLRVLKGTALYTSAFTPPTAPSTAITNTKLLLSFTNAAMFDQTGKSNIETVGNAQLNTSIKKFGTASAKFDESGDYLVVRNPIFLGGGDFTIEGFVYFNSSPTDGQGLFVYDSAVMGNRAGYGPALGTYANAPYQGKWHSYYGTQATPGTGTQGNSEATPSATTWIHFAYVRTSGVIKIFIGGSQIGSDIAWTGNYKANDVLTIAGYYSTSYLLNGYIDSYRVTLKARYTSNFTPPSEEFPNR